MGHEGCTKFKHQALNLKLLNLSIKAYTRDMHGILNPKAYTLNMHGIPKLYP